MDLLAQSSRSSRAQVLGGQDVEGGEGLVHEEHFGLDDQGAGESHALLHSAGEFFGISAFEAVQPDRFEDLQTPFAAGNLADSRGL